MAAPTLKPPLLLLLLLASACAASDVSHDPRPLPDPPDTASKSEAAPITASPQKYDDLADLEARLEVYEQQLATNEARLRAMGVLVAAREAAPSADAAASAPGRFAPPPPAAPTSSAAKEESAGRSMGASKQPRKELAKTKRAGAAGKAATTTPATKPTTRHDGDARAADAAAGAESRPDADRGRCAELCDLADSTCDLEGKICDLAARHPGDARYAEVCRRADEDCRIAAEACTVCSP